MSTKQQLKVLDFIKTYREDNGEYPTLQQICDGIGLKAVSTVHAHIQKLVDQNILSKDSNYSGYKINCVEPIITDVPVIGYIAAGQPIEAIELLDQGISSIAGLPKNSTFYALKVKGDSMIDDGIFDGDTVIIKQQSSARNGQTVVAIIDDNQATLKKIYKENDGFRLQPANQSMLPFFRKEVEIRGIVWSIQRNYGKDINKSFSDNIRTIDLFAGIGGVRLGFEKAGFKTVFSNDFEPKCKLTYDLNFADSKLVVEDITKIKVEDLPEFDFLLGGFPCQAFSIAGHRQGFDDLKGRGNLFFDVANIIAERKPAGFLLENVKNLKTHDGGNTFKIIYKTLEDLGYFIKHKVMNSMEYGSVPQNRERIYIVGFRDKQKFEAFEFPEPIKLQKNIKDILENNVDSKYYYNDKPLFDKLKDFVDEEGAVYQWRRQYVRKNKKGVSPTLTANMGMGGHNVPIIYDGIGIRKLTPRECLRLQGFPDNYKIPNIADSTIYKQAGNSVSVPVLERIAKNIMQVM